ncbi:Membrane alanine aminopeptidase N [Collimonas arenae]|uniref:Aminopeptidase n=1 Tax=Collimonas arenae TaxID=279058 RepID=A0A0A1FF10_9BURK|nr:M1 family metallopeptidase [Collimonas arenae]AIY43333.1 Membrane alanine aminopeptidase N [Collimonas arenae]
MCTTRRFTLAALALSISSFNAAAATPDDVAPLGKLPRWAQPLAYHLDFRVDPQQSAYTGSAAIDIELKQAADHLWLHGQDLKVSKVTLSDSAKKIHAAQYKVAAQKEGVATVEFGKTLPAGRYRMTLEYSAPFNEQLEGVYKVSNQGVPYVITQMEAISARYAFPGFDEPSFKTPFTLSLTVPENQVAVANTQQISEQKLDNGWHKLSFAATKPLPTYLVAFAVGPWDVVDGPQIPATQWRAQATPLRGIAPHGEGPRIKPALAQTPAIITALEDYFGFGYPFDKVDLLAAPDFAAGAMENPGLVTFRDYLMLLDANSPAHNVRSSFNVAAHELAHQWFGDTVTMPWWDDLWLNEAFATWMQAKITQQLHPEYRADLALIGGANSAMQSDSLVSVRKIRQPITGNGDIETAFDGITYEKGAAVLNMFERYLGADTFRQGVRAYVKQHQFSSATADDLVAALAKASGKDQRFAKAMQSFLDQPGVPLIDTALHWENGKAVLHMKQQRYLPLGSAGNANTLWGIPVCVRYSIANGAPKTQCDLLDQAQGTMVLPDATASSWYMPNADAAGYYRFDMAHDDLARLTGNLAQLPDTEQLAYADAINAGFGHGDLDAAAVLAAAPVLAQSSTREVATALLPTLKWLSKYEVRNEAQHNRLTELARKMYLPRLQQLGYQRRVNESQDDALLRATLAQFLALDVKLPEVRQALLLQGDKALEKNANGQLDLVAANPDLLRAVLSVTAQEQGTPAIDVLIKALGNTNEPAQRMAILSGLGAVTASAGAERARNLALDPRVKVGEMSTVLRASREDGEGREAMWKWFKLNHEQVIKRSGEASGGRLPDLIAGDSCSQSEAERLGAFFQPLLGQLPGAERGLAQTREKTLLCTALREKQDPAAILR